MAVEISGDSRIVGGGSSGAIKSKVEEGEDVHCNRVFCRGWFAKGGLKSSELEKDEADVSLAIAGPTYIRAACLGSENSDNGDRVLVQVSVKAFCQFP